MAGVPEQDLPDGVIPAGFYTLIRGGITVEYNDGSYSLLPITRMEASAKSDYFKTDANKTPTTNPLKRPTMHEIFGHGRTLALKIADQQTPIIQFENLVLRVMKKGVYRDGSNHDNGVVVQNYSAIPEYLYSTNSGLRHFIFATLCKSNIYKDSCVQTSFFSV